MAKSLEKYSNYKIYLLNIIGEFNQFNHPNIKKINFFNFDFLHKTKILGKFFIYFLTFLSLPFLFYWILKEKPKRWVRRKKVVVVVQIKEDLTRHKKEVLFVLVPLFRICQLDKKEGVSVLEPSSRISL